METPRAASAREISERFGVPASMMMNVLKELSASGYVESVRGAHGGYRLARDPDQINLGDLIATIERPVRLAECVTDAAGEDECTCELMARCPISDPVHRVHRKLADFLKILAEREINVTALRVISRRAEEAQVLFSVDRADAALEIPGVRYAENVAYFSDAARIE